MSGDPKDRTLVIEQGRTLQQWFRIRNMQTGEIVNPVSAGYTVAKLHVRDKFREDAGAVLLELSTANGGIVLGNINDGTGTYWSGYLYATDTATRVLQHVGDPVYDLVMIHTGGRKETAFRGSVYVIPEVTEP